MAIALVGTRAFGAATAAGASFSLTLTTGAAITPGNTLIMDLAFRDVATPPTDPDAIPGDSVAQDTRGNFWRRVGYSVNAGATSAADDGAVVHIWVCHVVFPYSNGDVITLRAPITSRPMTHVVGQIREWSGVWRVSYPLDFDATTGNSAASSVPTINPTAAGQLVIGAVAVANIPALTGDADATNGAWTAITTQASGAGGIIRGEQAKIVTAAGAQTWDVTWVGAQRWAAAAVVLQAAPAAWPQNSEHLANPGYPCPAGPEILPTSRTVTPIDTGTAYLFDTALPPESVGSSNIYWYGDINVPRDDVDVQHRVAVDVYPRGAELSRTDPFIYTLGTPDFCVAFDGAMTDPGGSTTSANLVAALSGSGGESVVLPANALTGVYGSVDCYWNASALLPLQDTHRILNLRLSYVAWKDDSAAPQPGEGLAVFWRDELAFSSGASSRATSLYGAWLTNEYKIQAGRVYRNLGEVNGLPRLGANIGEQYANVQACWTIRDLLHMSSGDRTTMFSIFGLTGSDVSQQQVFLDTVRLDVYLVPETRLAQSVRRVTSGVGFPGNLAAQAGGEKIQPLYIATNSWLNWLAPSVPTDITVAVREPIVSTGSDWYSAQTDPTILDNSILGTSRYSTQEAVGPSVVMKSLTQPRETLDPQVSVRRAEWSNGQIAQGADAEPFGSMIQSLSLIDFNSYSGFWPAYIADNFIPTEAYTGNPVTQTIGVDGVTTYDAVKILIKPSDLTTGALTVTVEQPALTVLATATLTVAECDALPDVGNGFKEARLDLNVAVTPAAGTVTVRLASTNAYNAGWIPGEGIALGAANTSYSRFNYQANPLVAPVTALDFAVVLCCPIDDPDVDIATGTATFPATSDRCISTSTDIPCLTINNAADYDYIGISRVTGADVVPITVISGTSLGVAIEDTFTRTEVNEWGTADTGQVWIDTGTSYSVSGGQGRINVAAANTAATIQLPFGSADQEILVSAGAAALSTGGSQGVAVIGRATDANNFYAARLLFGTTGQLTLTLSQVLAGVVTFQANATVPGTHVAGTMYNIRYSLQGDTLRAKAWDPATQPEPGWQVSFTDPTPIPAGTQAGVWGERGAGNTNVSALLTFDNFEVMDASVPLEWCDYGVPWDLISGSIEYLVTGYRENDRAEATVLVGPWAGTSTAPGAAFGLAGSDFLVAYVPVSESGELQVTWSPLNPIESMPLAGIDYQVALRASEERGLTITVTVIADHLLRCEITDNSTTYDESGLVYDEEGYTYEGNTGSESFSSRALGGRSLTPSPYNLIRSLERVDRLELKLPGGHNRYVTLDVGALVSTPVAGIFLAEITLTDTLVPGTSPYQSPGGEPVAGLDA